MADGDVTVTVVQNPTALSVSGALTAIRSSISMSGSIGCFGHDGRIWCWGVEES